MGFDPDLDMACRDDSLFVSENRASNAIPGGGSKQHFGRKENPRHGGTFWALARDRPGGLR